MAQDPFASIAKPIQDDPFAAIAKPIDGTSVAPSQHPVMDAVSDFGKGILKSVISTMSAADDFAQKHLPAFMTTPIGQAPTAENSARAVAAAKQMATANNTAQSIGKGIGNAAQFLIPGAAEEAGASMLAPTIGKVGAKLATSALGSGVVNAAQGGSFAGGAAAGGAGAGLGMGLKAIAPALAETALRVRGADRGYGATPGRAILDLTSGIKPSTVTSTARKSMSNLGNEADSLAAGYHQPIDLTPTRSGVANSLGDASVRNEKGTIKDLSDLSDQLNKDYLTKNPIPAQVPATQAVQLKRGIGDFRNFSPNIRSDFGDAAAGSAYHQLGQDINAAIPEMEPLNKSMQSLQPVIKRGSAADLNAGLLQRMSGRMTAHTGALLGGVTGYNAYGIPGAVAGVLGPELLGSPEFQMGAARIANSPITRKALPAVTGLGLQLDRPTSK